MGRTESTPMDSTITGLRTYKKFVKLSHEVEVGRPQPLAGVKFTLDEMKSLVAAGRLVFLPKYEAEFTKRVNGAYITSKELK